MCQLVRFSIPLLLACATVACSPKNIGINRMADALSSTATSYSRDDDPEFVRLAAPSTLKMVEMLLDSQPAHPGLLMTACSGFTQYAYGFLQVEAEQIELSDRAAAKELRGRALRMYDRARGYCQRALELRHPGVGVALKSNPASALSWMTVADVPALFWLGAALGGAVSVSEIPLLRLGDLAIVRAVLGRALVLDEAWEQGTIHEAMIALEGLPSLLGGSAARAREHFDRAVALSKGTSALAYVTLASSVAQPAKNRAEFKRLLDAALAVDASRAPALRLANLIAQRRARWLLSQIERIF